MKRWNKLIERLIVLYIFVLPWQTMWIWRERFLGGAKWQYGTIIIYASQILLWLILIGQLIVWFRRRPITVRDALNVLAGRSGRQNSRRFFVAVIGLLTLWPLSSFFWSLDKSLVFYVWLQLAGAIGLFVIILAKGYSRLQIAWPLMLAGLVQGGLAIIQFFNQRISANKWLGLAEHLSGDLGTAVIETADGRWLRAYGSFNHPNVLGGFLAVSFLAGFLVYNRYQPGGRRILAAISLAIISGGLFFSFSRSAWLALALIGILGLVFYLGRERLSLVQTLDKFKPALYGIIIFAWLFIIYQPLVIERASFSERLEIKSAQERISLMSEAKNISQNNWLLGVGLGNYTVAACRQYPLRSAFDCQPVHNLYWLIFAELGLIGLLLALVFIGLSIGQISRQQQKSWPLFWLILLLALSVFDHYLWTSYVGLMVFWLIMALVLIEDDNI